MSANLKPLQDAIKLVIDGVQDSMSAAASGGGIMAIANFSNILPDLFVLLPEIGQIPSPATLTAPDYEALIASIAADLNVKGQSSVVVQDALKLLHDITNIIVPDVLALIAAAKGA